MYSKMDVSDFRHLHVINLTGPDAVEDEEKLNEDAAEWEDAAHDDAGDGLGVDGLVRNLPRYLVGPHLSFVN